MWGEVNRMSPEAPVPVVTYIEEKETRGIKNFANFKNNIKLLNPKNLTTIPHLEP